MGDLIIIDDPNPLIEVIEPRIWRRIRPQEIEIGPGTERAASSSSPIARLRAYSFLEHDCFRLKPSCSTVTMSESMIHAFRPGSLRRSCSNAVRIAFRQDIPNIIPALPLGRRRFVSWSRNVD